MASRFEYGLRQWREEFPKGKVVAVFGVGLDGHTCGIIPDINPEKTKSKELFKNRFNDTDKWVVGYDDANNEYKERVTITMPFIKEQVDHAVVFVSGENKRKALDNLLASEGDINKTPARVLRDIKDVEVFTDIL